MLLRKSVVLVLLSVGVFTLTLSAQDAKKTPPKIMDRVVGAWKIQKIMSGSKEVAKNPTSGQWIEFKSDGRYVNQSTSLDSGLYRTDENRSVLYLESDIHPGSSKNSPKEIGEWSVAFHEDTMTLQRLNKKQHADKMKYIYLKIADGSTASNH